MESPQRVNTPTGTTTDQPREIEPVPLPARLSLLGLPSEIRLMILRYLLCSDTQLYVSCPAIEVQLAKLGTSREAEKDDEDDDGINGDEGQQANSTTQPSVDTTAATGSEPQKDETTLCVNQPVDRAEARNRYTYMYDFALYPSILASCQQLYNEGHPLLYNNDKVVVVRYYYESQLDCDVPIAFLRAYVVGAKSVSDALQKYPSLKLFKKWQIYLLLAGDEEDLEQQIEECEDILLWSSFIQTEVRALNEVENLQSLVMEAIVYTRDLDGNVWEQPDIAYLKLFCNPFGLLHVQTSEVRLADKPTTYVEIEELEQNIMTSMEHKTERKVTIQAMHDQFLEVFNHIAQKMNGVVWDSAVDILVPRHWQTSYATFSFECVMLDRYEHNLRAIEMAYRLYDTKEFQGLCEELIFDIRGYLSTALETLIEQKEKVSTIVTTETVQEPEDENSRDQQQSTENQQQVAIAQEIALLEPMLAKISDYLNMSIYYRWV